LPLDCVLSSTPLINLVVPTILTSNGTIVLSGSDLKLNLGHKISNMSFTEMVESNSAFHSNTGSAITSIQDAIASLAVSIPTAVSASEARSQISLHQAITQLNTSINAQEAAIVENTQIAISNLSSAVTAAALSAASVSSNVVSISSAHGSLSTIVASLSTQTTDSTISGSSTFHTTHGLVESASTRP
jgi:hypothetical protein